MFAVASEASGPHSFTLDNNTVKHGFGVSPDVKHRTLPMDDTKLVIDSSSPRTPQAKADNESVRRRLRESLTSALEMVVSKQLVKSVLGVAKGADDSGDEQKIVSACPEKVSPSGNVSGSNETVSVEQLAGIKGSVVQASSGKECDEREVACEGNESPAKKLKSDRGVSGADEMKGGLQLMDQAKNVAWNVELSLLSFYGGVNKKYKEKARSLLFNLKDKSNPELRARVFNGEIAPDVLVRMTAEQLASKELSQWRSAKAEEYASMVVLTDADVDPRRIVKKTHKGEFRLAVEEIDFPVSAESGGSGRTFPDGSKRESEDSRGEESTAGTVGQGSAERKLSSSSHKADAGDGAREPETTNEKVENGANEKEATPVDFGKSLPTIMSLDEYIHNRDDSGGASVEPSRAGDFFEDRAVDPVLTEKNGERLLPYSPTSLSDICTPKLSESPTPRNADSVSFQGRQLARTTENGIGIPVWEGSIQLSATRFAFIDGFFKSGERLELKDWPKSVEVKGRVRLGALDKFLQDLQLSRSRTVTILSLCPADGRGDAKQTQAYLKEMADQYCMGDRAGFVEPRPGFELYLLAPGSNSLELLSEDLRSMNANSQRDDEVLVGVVVWRKSQSQGLQSSRGSDQNANVKKVALSNLLSPSPHLNAKPVYRTETTSLQGTSPVSRKTTSAPSLVNSSIHSTWSQIDSASSDPALRRDWQQPFAGAVGQLQVSGPNVTTVAKNVHDTILDSRPHQQESVELSDGPPGFLPRPMQSFSQSRSMPLNADSGTPVGGFQAPLAGHFPGQGSMVGNGSRNASQDIPPGFVGRPSVKAPTGRDDEEDDLPEFNFEAERIVPETPPAILSPVNQSQFLAPNKYNIAQHSLAGLQQMSGPGYRYQGYHNTSHDSRQGAVDLLHGHSELPTKHVLQAEGPLGSSSGAYIEGASSADGQVRGRGQPMFHEFPRSALPMNGPALGNPQSRSIRVESGPPEEEFRKFSHDSQIQETLGPSVRAPVNFPPPQPPFLNGVGESVGDVNVPKKDMPVWRPGPAPPTPWPQSSHPTTFSNNHHPMNVHQQLSLAHLIAQTQLAARKENAIIWPRVPQSVPQQEIRHDHGQVLNMSNTPLWQHPSPVKIHNRASNPHRKLDQRGSVNDKHHLSGNKYGGRHWRDHSHTRDRSRQRSLSPSRENGQGRRRSHSPSRDNGQGRRRSASPSRESGQARHRSRSLSPSREVESRKDVGATGDPTNEKTETKPKRERERDQ